MGMIEYKQKAGKVIPITPEDDFPKCVCGGDFKINYIETKKGEHWGSTADCKECKEHFFQGNYEELKRNIPKGQIARLSK